VRDEGVAKAVGVEPIRPPTVRLDCLGPLKVANLQAISGHLHASLETRDQIALMRGLKEVLSVMTSSLHSDLGLLASQTFKSLKSFAL